MVCPECKRLNPDQSVYCPYCSNVFNQEEYDKAIEIGEVFSESTPQNNEQVSAPKYLRTGWILLCGAVVCFFALIVLIFNVSDPAEKIVKNYAEAFYSADFYETVEASAVNLEKCYSATTQNNFGNFFGLFNPYSSYEDMLNSYMTSFNTNKNKIISIYGADFKVKIKIKNHVKLHEKVMMSFLTEYNNLYGDILRNGEIQEMRYIYADVSLEGSGGNNNQIMQFIILKIDKKWYVVTDDMLNAVSNN